jgi:hypothetical protein
MTNDLEIKQTLPKSSDYAANRQCICSENEHCLFTAYSLPIQCVFTAYSLPIHFLLSTASSLPIYCLFTASNIHCLFTAYSLPIHYIFTVYSLPIQSLFTACTAVYLSVLDCTRLYSTVLDCTRTRMYSTVPQRTVQEHPQPLPSTHSTSQLHRYSVEIHSVIQEMGHTNDAADMACPSPA